MTGADPVAHGPSVRVLPRLEDANRFFWTRGRGRAAALPALHRLPPLRASPRARAARTASTARLVPEVGERQRRGALLHGELPAMDPRVRPLRDRAGHHRRAGRRPAHHEPRGLRRPTTSTSAWRWRSPSSRPRTCGSRCSARRSRRGDEPSRAPRAQVDHLGHRPVRRGTPPRARRPRPHRGSVPGGRRRRRAHPRRHRRAGHLPRGWAWAREVSPAPRPPRSKTPCA